jgi:hypothetical protein
MGILSSSDVQNFADLITNLAMDMDCIISRIPETDDPYGTSTSGTPIVVIESKCLVELLPNPFILQDYNDKIGVLIKWNVSFPLGTNPLQGDILTIAGQDMKVQKVLQPESYSFTDDVLCAEIVSNG